MPVLTERDLLLFGQRWWKPMTGPKRRFASIDLVWLMNIREHLGLVHDRARSEMDAAYSFSGGEMAEMYAGHAADHSARVADNAQRLAGYLGQYISWRAQHETVLPGRWK